MKNKITESEYERIWNNVKKAVQSEVKDGKVEYKTLYNEKRKYGRGIKYYDIDKGSNQILELLKTHFKDYDFVVVSKKLLHFSGYKIVVIIKVIMDHYPKVDVHKPTVKVVMIDNTELSEALECLNCGGHMKLDNTFLDQVSDSVNCPYCSTKLIYTGGVE